VGRVLTEALAPVHHGTSPATSGEGQP